MHEEDKPVNGKDNPMDFLPWLREARQQIHEETKKLTLEERVAYWKKSRSEFTEPEPIHPE